MPLALLLLSSEQEHIALLALELERTATDEICVVLLVYQTIGRREDGDASGSNEMQSNTDSDRPGRLSCFQM